MRVTPPDHTALEMNPEIAQTLAAARNVEDGVVRHVEAPREVDGLQAEAVATQYGQSAVPSDLADVIAVAAGGCSRSRRRLSAIGVACRSDSPALPLRCDVPRSCHTFRLRYDCFAKMGFSPSQRGDWTGIRGRGPRGPG